MLALKILHPEYARVTEVRERFLREGRIANQVDHPGRVPVIDDDVTEEGEPFLVMELLEGETLGALWRRSGKKLSPEQALQVFDPVLDLLSACHKVGIIHRDIKPPNVFIMHSGAVRVLDFGVARMRAADQAMTMAGTALGTPSYMAPEQALGIGEKVDARADLFSVGACLYAMLAGERLHRARTENESLVLAATQAAPSLARTAPDLPVELVAFVDKSLAFDPNHRFQDAASMRRELIAVLEGIRSGRFVAQKIDKRAGVVVRASDDVVDDSEARASPEERARRIQLLQEAWRLTATYMATTRQYGHAHPNSGRALDAAFGALLEALTFDPAGVCWDVTPYGFMVGEDAIWEPDRAPFDRIPYQLFADGFRKLQINPGIAQQEFCDLITLIGRDDTDAQEDDAVSAFWDRRFEHVVYFAVYAFAEGDGDRRTDFAERCEIAAREAVVSAQLDRSWHVDSIESRALAENVRSAVIQAGAAAESIALEPQVRASLGVQLNEPPERWTDRFVDAFADGYVESCRAGDSSRLAGLLREWSRDQVTLRNLGSLFDMFGWLTSAVAARRGSDRESAEREMADAVFGVERLKAILAQLAQEGAGQTLPSSTVVDGVKKLLRLTESDEALQIACECFQSVRSEPLRDALVDYVSRWANGRESDLAKVLAGADPELSSAILRLVARSAAPQAMLVIERALSSPHSGVRTEALQLMPSAYAEKLAPQIERLLGDPEAVVRREALRAILTHGIASAVPALHRRTQAKSFHEVAITERREWLTTLWKLAPQKAEEVLIAILSETRIIPSEDVEETRAVAADLIGQASSEEALKAARLAARKWWWNSPGVREAGARSADAIAACLGAAAAGTPSPDPKEPAR